MMEKICIADFPLACRIAARRLPPMWVNELRQTSGRVRLRGNDDASVFIDGCQPAEDRFKSGLPRDRRSPTRHRRVEWVRQWFDKVYLEFSDFATETRRGKEQYRKADRAISLDSARSFAAASLSPRRFCRPHYRIADSRARVAPRCAAGSSQNSTTFTWRSSACWTMPRGRRGRGRARGAPGRSRRPPRRRYTRQTTDGISRGANACKSISALDRNSYSHQSQVTSPQSSHKSSVESPVPSRVASPSPFAILRGHHRLNSSAHREIADDGHPPRVNRRDEVVENLIGHRFVKMPLLRNSIR